MRGLAATVALAVVALAAPACAHGRGPIVLGAVYPISGRQGPGGADEERGAALAVELANEDGGVHGRQVKLDLRDVETAEAAPAAIRALHGRGVSLVLGTYGSTISVAAGGEAARRGMLLWETGAVGEVAPDMRPGASFFRLAPMGDGLGAAAVGFVRDTLAARLAVHRPLRYAVSYVDDVYGRSVGLGALHELQSSGQTVVGTFPYDLRTVDFDALAARIAAVHPDVLVVSAYLDDGVALRKATIAEHVPLLASIGTSSSYCMPAFGDQLGAGAVGLFASDKPDAADVRIDQLSAEGRRTLAWAQARYTARYHEPMSAAALSGFANAWALVGHVLPAAHGTGAGSVARAALALKLPRGTLANGSGLDLAPPGAGDAGANRAAVSVIWEWVAPRQRAVVWPPAYATHPVSVLAIAA